MRAIVVGGGALSRELFVAATQLGWPVLPSYGLTECCSQVATAAPAEWRERFAQAQNNEVELEPLPIYLLSHVKVESSENIPLKIQSPSLLTARITLNDEDGRFEDPKIGGWFQTEDFADVVRVQGKPALQVQGRGGDFVKIGGEGVNVAALEAKLQKLRIDHGFHWDVALIAVEDPRLGHVIQLLVVPAPHEKRQLLVDAFAEQVLPFERIRKVTEVDRIPRSALGKLLQGEAKRLATGAGLS